MSARSWQVLRSEFGTYRYLTLRKVPSVTFKDRSRLEHVCQLEAFFGGAATHHNGNSW